MPDLWVDVDTAVIVPVNILPLLDDTDFKTIETAIVYNSAGMDLVWNFQTAAGVVTGTAVTPTTGGNYDWSEPVADKGMYAIEIPASGGASANNDTEGVGWFTGVATGVLPWRGPTIGFRRAALNDLFMDGGTASTNLEDFFDGTGYAGGTAKLTVDVTAVSGDATAADNLEAAFDGNTYNVGGGAIVAASVTGAVGSVTGAVGSVTGNVGGNVTGSVGSVASGGITAASIATNAIDADALAADAVTEIQAGLATPTNITAGTITTVTNLTNAPTSGDFTATMKTSLNAATPTVTAGTVSDKTGYALSAGGVTAVQSGLATSASIAALNNLSAAQVNSEVVDALSVDVIADSVAADGSRPTIAQALLMLVRFLMEKGVVGTLATVYKEDGTTASMTFTLDSATAPTAISRTT